MSDLAIDKRKILLKELLSELKETEITLLGFTDIIEKLSDVYYQQAFSEGREEIQQEIEKYRSNNNRISAINKEITARINLWYEFVKNANERVKVSFPILFALKKKNLQKYLNKTNSEISSITIENRFAKEKLTLLEHQLEIKAMQKIKADNAYLDFDRLLQKKDLLIPELDYLIPTVPGLCPASIGSSGVEELLVKLSISIV